MRWADLQEIEESASLPEGPLKRKNVLIAAISTHALMRDPHARFKPGTHIGVDMTGTLAGASPYLVNVWVVAVGGWRHGWFPRAIPKLRTLSLPVHSSVSGAVRAF